MDPHSIAEQARAALRMAPEDPQQAESLALEALDGAVRGGLTHAEATARRALGLAARARHRIPEALAHLRAAVAVAERSADADMTAEARLSLAAALVLAGDNNEAMTILDGARATGPVAVVVASQRAMVLTMLGRYEESLAAFRPVIPALRRQGDHVRLARALNNRGLMRVYTGRFTQAEVDLGEAERLMAAAGNLTEAAGYCHNRGFAAARRGDLPGALALFAEADRRCRDMGVQSGARGLDRAGVLEAAGLLREAGVAAGEAVSQLREGGNHSDLAEGLVLVSDIAFVAGDDGASRRAAEEAERLFGDQERDGWQALAQAAVARAGLGLGDGAPALAAVASDAAARLDAMGLADRATMAHAVAGRLWLQAGVLDAGLAELDRAGSARRRGSAAGRLAAWEAVARARVRRGDRRGAMAAVARALDVMDDQQASLGATELRAHVAVHAGDAARLGLHLALETGRPSCLWQWMERHRANGLRSWPVRPPPDELLAGQLAELRGLVVDIAASAMAGRDPGELVARQSDLERRVRERSWEAAGPKAANRARVPKLADVVPALREAALVELAEIDGHLHVVVIAGRRCHHRRLGLAAEVDRELSHLRMALRRLAYRGARATLGSGAGAQLTRATVALDRLLVEPIATLIGSRPLVVVPTGELHALPWSALPTLRGRPVAVAPSARLWLDAATTGATSGPSPARRRTVIVGGPGLPGAAREAATLGRLHPSAQVLTGAEAGVAAVITALEGAGLVHIAAHACFRADSGLWSSLELADGALTVYELEQLRHPPDIVVLSACQSGLSLVRPGNELMGLVAALLALGTTAVVASVVPVEDEADEELMVTLHRRLLAGDPPAVALARAQAVSTDPVNLSYVCFGRT